MQTSAGNGVAAKKRAKKEEATDEKKDKDKDKGKKVLKSKGRPPKMMVDAAQSDGDVQECEESRFVVALFNPCSQSTLM